MFLHHITEHTAQHLAMGVPLFQLQAAQALPEAKVPGRIAVPQFSRAWYVNTAQACKLYDFQQRYGTDFGGRRPAHQPINGDAHAHHAHAGG